MQVHLPTALKEVYRRWATHDWHSMDRLHAIFTIVSVHAGADAVLRGTLTRNNGFGIHAGHYPDFEEIQILKNTSSNQIFGSK